MAFWKEDLGSTLRKERRSKMSTLAKVKITLTIITWVSLFLSYMIMESTHPSNFVVPLLDEMYGKNATFVANNIYSQIAFIICIFALLLSISNNILMFKYNKRKSDKISPLTILSFIISFTASIYFIMYIFQ